MFARFRRQRAAPPPVQTLQACRDEAAMKLGYAIMTALDQANGSPLHTATRAMIEALLWPYLTDDDYLSVARFASWDFRARHLPWVPTADAPSADDDIPF